MTSHLPGRLGNPNMDIKDDPRADPRMIAAMGLIGLDVAPEEMPVTPDSSLDEILEFVIASEVGFNELGTALTGATPPTQNVTSYTEVIQGVDGNDINLYIHKPTNIEGPLPAIVHTHGGLSLIHI